MTTSVLELGADIEAVPELRVENVSLRFGGISALDEVSFTVRPGTIHALIGPNGAGKSSCFNVICGVYAPTQGRVVLGDTVLTGLRPHRLARLGLGRSFQNIALSPHETVLDNVMLGRHTLTAGGFLAAGLRIPRVIRQQNAHRRRAAEICDFIGVGEWLDAEVATLPYGVAKLVDMARALAVEPAVLLLDEPAAGLDMTETEAVARTIRDISAGLGISVLLVEHDMSLVMDVADRVTVLDFGRLIADGDPKDVQRDQDVVKAYLGTGEEI